MRYGVTARRKRNMRRMGELQALREARRTFRRAAGTAAIAASEADLSGKLVAEAKEVGKAFGDRPIVADFSFRLLRGDRLGIVGPNGSGKTTLVSLLTGALAPDVGTVRIGANVEMAALDQGRESLDPNWTLSEALTGGRGDFVTVGGVKKHVGRLHEGLPVLGGAGALAAARAVGRRARPADAGARAGQAVQPAGARRADQRSRPRDPRRAGGDARRLRRHRHPHQPRPRLPRPRRQLGAGAGGRGPLGRVRRRLRRHAGAARRRPRRHQDGDRLEGRPQAVARPRHRAAAAHRQDGQAPPELQGEARARKPSRARSPHCRTAYAGFRSSWTTRASTPATGRRSRKPARRSRPPRRSSPRRRSAGSSSSCCARRSRARDGVVIPAPHVPPARAFAEDAGWIRPLPSRASQVG